MPKVEINFIKTLKVQVPFETIQSEIKHFILNKFFSKKLDQKSITVNIHLVDTKKIQSLNKNFRKIDKITDVLSFPIYQDKSEITKEKSPEIYLGDIFICYAIAKNQAKKHKKSLIGELVFLSLHGIKHLIGIHHK